MAKRTWLIFLALFGCAHAEVPAPCPSSPTGTQAAPNTPTVGAKSPPGPPLAILLRPTFLPTPIVHVEVDLDPRAPLGAVDLVTWRLNAGSPERITHAIARDSGGDIPVALGVHGQGPALYLTLARAPAGPVHVAYDVLTGEDSPDDPFGLLVLDDRFRGAGEKLIALPESIEDISMPLRLEIDGEPLRAERTASSLGVGTVRRATIRPRALRYASFLAGSLGTQLIDTSEGHDEGAWLGYTMFDPRPVVAELAHVRTALAELFHSGSDGASTPWTYLIMARARPIGSFSTTPRFQSALLQVGPSEPWAGALRLSMAQQLARRWIGDAIRFSVAPGHEWELGWFNDGVARYVATVLLARLGLLSPSEWRDAIAGELSVLATSPYASQGGAALAALASKDPVARATMMARGALYALRESAVIEARSKGARRLENVLTDLLHQARPEKAAATTTLPASAWLDTLSKDDPEAAKSFDALLTKGGTIALPEGALGPCFRAETGEYVAFDAGFDIEATRIDETGRVRGVRPNGPAAKAGLANGDVMESMSAREDDASVPVKIVVTRPGTSQKIQITYSPRGAHGRGQTWARVKGVPDDKCGEPP
jgi:hypothetical protein